MSRHFRQRGYPNGQKTYKNVSNFIIVTMERQNKTTMKYYYVTIRMAKMEKADNIKYLTGI